jgi:hypothetical protein
MMFPLGFENLITGMAGALFVMGAISLGAGVFILVSKVMGEDVRLLAQETAKLAQKGFAEDVAGLVGNASALLDALNQLVRTTSGIGIFLILTGFGLIGTSYFLLLQIK